MTSQRLEMVRALLGLGGCCNHFLLGHSFSKAGCLPEEMIYIPSFQSLIQEDWLSDFMLVSEVGFHCK